MGVKLTPRELTRSLLVLMRSGVSDVYPKPFELAALAHCWKFVCPKLSSIDLLSYRPVSAHVMAAPKHAYTVRPVALPDPVDVLLFTGVVARLASVIEEQRLPGDKKCICTVQCANGGYRAVIRGDLVDVPLVMSHRYLDNGREALFSRSPTWREVRDVVGQKARRSRFVAVTDIVDFYTRIYLHRLENALQAMSQKTEEVAAVMGFLKPWAHGTSYGIPVGPQASHVLAEAALHEVDEYLRDKNVNFVRFVDDIYIFGDTSQQCQTALLQLGQRLHETQGLSLNAAKTRIQTQAEFLNAEELSLPDTEFGHYAALAVLSGWDPYLDLDYDDISDDTRQALSKIKTRAIFQSGMRDTGITRLSKMKVALIIDKALRRDTLLPMIIADLFHFAPLSAYVGKYLTALVHAAPESTPAWANDVLEFIKRARDHRVYDYEVMWLLEPFAHVAAPPKALRDLRHLLDHPNPLVRRQACLAISRTENRSALLDVRSRIGDMTPWEARAAIFACRALPPDERDAFYRSLRVTKDWQPDPRSLLLKAVLEYARDLASGSAPPPEVVIRNWLDSCTLEEMS